MKRSIIAIALVLAAAGAGRAQSDSTKPDSATVSVQARDDAAGAAAMTVTTEHIGADTAITVRIGNEPQRLGRKRRPWNWAVGMKAYSVSALPGSLFLQRRIGGRVLVGCGFEYDRNDYVGIPGIGNNNDDYAYEYYRYHNSYSSWSVEFTPECLVPILRHRRFRMLAGAAVDLRYGEARGDHSETTYYPGNDTSWVTVDGHGKRNCYAMSLPVVIERDFRIRRYAFTVGIESVLASLSYERQTGSSVQVSRHGTSPAQSSNQYRSWTYPWRATLRNPFQGGVNLLVKWYL